MRSGEKGEEEEGKEVRRRQGGVSSSWQRFQFVNIGGSRVEW